MILEIILGVLCIPPIAAIFSRKVSYVTNSIISSLIIILSLLMLLSVIKSSSFSMGYLSFSVDKLSAVFLFILGLVVLLDSIFSLFLVMKEKYFVNAIMDIPAPSAARLPANMAVREIYVCGPVEVIKRDSRSIHSPIPFHTWTNSAS